jgi:hypothetical protein
MELKQQTRIAGLLKPQYDKTAGMYLSQYPKVLILRSMRTQCQELICKLPTAWYNGEAERLLFDPLWTSLVKGSEGVSPQQQAYRLAANYSVVAETMQLTTSKDILTTVAGAGAISQDVISQIISASSGSTDAEDSDAVKKAFSSVLKWLSGKKQDSKVRDSLTLLYELYQNEPATNLTGELTNKSVWKTLMSSMYKGKGFPLNKEATSQRIASITQVLAVIDADIALAEAEAQAASTAQTLSVADGPYVRAFTAMYWLIRYLAAVLDYDVVFPTQPMPTQSQAFLFNMKLRSQELRNFYLDIATAVVYVDLYSADRVWAGVRQFYGPILESDKVSQLSDLDSVWAGVSESITSGAPKFVMSAVEDAQDGLKKLIAVDNLLPRELFSKLAGSLDKSYEKLSALRKTGVPTGTAALEIRDYTQPLSITGFSKATIMTDLSTVCSSLQTILAYLSKVKQIMRISDLGATATGRIPEAPQLNFDELPESLQPKPADFNKHNSLTPLSLKFSVKASATGVMEISWIHDDELYKPVFKSESIRAGLKAVVSDPDSRIYWGTGITINTGDVLTLPYMMQPIVANYTITRNRQIVGADMSSYLDAISGFYGLALNKSEYFSQIALIMQGGVTTYAPAMANALSSLMFVYKREGETWNWIRPTIPTIYGAPVQLYKDINTDPETAYGELSAPTSDNVQVVGTQSAAVRLADGSTYLFVLHKYVMPLDDVYTVLVPFAQREVIPCPVSKYIWDAAGMTSILGLTKEDNGRTYIKAEIDSYDGALESLKAKGNDPEQKEENQLAYRKQLVSGFAPFRLLLPHVLFGVNPSDWLTLDDMFSKYLTLTVKSRWVEALKAMEVMGFYDDPIIMYTADDRSAAFSQADPSPISSDAATSRDSDVTNDGEDPARSESAAQPEPTAPAPKPQSGDKDADKSETLKLAGTVTQAAVVPEETEKGGKVSANIKSPDSAASSIDSQEKIAAGSPSDKSSTHVSEESATTKTPRIWKKIEEGKVVDVVISDTCPDGYVPASQEDLDAFRASQGKVGDALEHGDESK